MTKLKSRADEVVSNVERKIICFESIVSKKGLLLASSGLEPPPTHCVNSIPIKYILYSNCVCFSISSVASLHDALLSTMYSNIYIQLAIIQSSKY